MKLPRTSSTDQPWRIHTLTRDFKTEDVWSYRAPGAGSDDFPVMLAAMRTGRETVHTLMRLGRGPSGDGTSDHELRTAVLVKPNGRFGQLHMAFIAPFRYLIVHPALARQWERAWRDRALLLPEGTSPQS